MHKFIAYSTFCYRNLMLSTDVSVTFLSIGVITVKYCCYRGFLLNTRVFNTATHIQVKSE